MEDHERAQMKRLIQQRVVRTQMGGSGKCGVYWAHIAKIPKLPYSDLLDILERCPHVIHPDTSTRRACIELLAPERVGRWRFYFGREHTRGPRGWLTFSEAGYRDVGSNETLRLRSADEWFSIGDVKALDPMKCFKRGGYVG